jgi:uncharacterized phage infection (PIP) family protein YhgE
MRAELSESPVKSLSRSWSNTVKILGAIFIAWLTLGQSSQAYTFHDPIHTVLNILQQTIGQIKEAGYQVENAAKYTDMINKQAQQIQQLTRMINQNAEALRRFGNPDYYTNMLSLDTLLTDVNKAKTGLGQTIGEVRSTASGMMALKNTAEGLYDDLSNLPDRFGEKVKMDVNSFKRFAVVQDLHSSYNAEMESANQSIARLQQEKQTALQQLNSAGSLVETEKWKGKLEAVQGSLDNWAARIHCAALKVLAQDAANRNDEARQAQASKEQSAQGLAKETATLLVGGRQSLELTDQSDSRPPTP